MNKTVLMNCWEKHKHLIPLGIRKHLGVLVRIRSGFKRMAERLFFGHMFLVWEKLGFHVTPKTFGSTIPILSELSDDVFERKSEMVGIELGAETQIQLLKHFNELYHDELTVFEKPPTHPWDYWLFWPVCAFPPVDAQVFYCMVRKHKPRRIYEFGSGQSTFIAAKAVLENKRENGLCAELVAFEPYPSWVLVDGFPGLSKVVRKKAEDIALSQFYPLKENDIVFIDSTHHMKIGSDVNWLYLEVLPRLPKGVLVHIHDIFLPCEYPKKWVREWKVFPNEQYLLQAFLTFNDTYEVIWASHYMHIHHPELLDKFFAGYDPKSQGPGSFWIRKVT